MKDWIRKISVSLMLAIGELLLGLLLLISPVELTSVVIIVLGALLTLLGCWHIFLYIRLQREEAAKTWYLATGAGLVVVGIAAIANQSWMVTLLGTLTTLYGSVALAAGFMKLQIAVDALRSRHPCWYLMAVSFLLTALLATLLFMNAIGENSVWIFTGVGLVVLAALDAVYFFLGRQSRKETEGATMPLA